MNDMNDMNDFTLDLDGAASTIDTGDASDMLVSVHATASRRRRRRNAVLGVAAAGTLVAGGVVVAGTVGNGGDDDNRLVTADSVVEPETTDPVDEPTPTVEPVPVPDAAASGQAAIPVSMTEGTTVDGVVDEVGNGSVRVLPWDGGFLAVSVVYAPQPLPEELPAEIVELFPQEVVDLFAAEGLPATIDEAIEQLNEAGLFEVVSEIVTSNPDAYDAIYGSSAATPMPDPTFRFSADGSEWSDIDVPVPADTYFDPWSVSSTGSRLIMLSDPANSPTFTSDEVATEDFVLWSTTDLANWESIAIERPAPEADAPSYVRQFAYAEPVLATNAGWVTQIYSHSDVDILSLLDPAVRAELEFAPYGIDSDDEGIRIQVFEFDENGAEVPGPPEELAYTWEELGLDGPVDVYGGEPDVTSVSGTWDSDVTSSVPGVGYERRTTVAGDWFVRLGTGATVSVSPDGVDWVDYELADAGFVTGVMDGGDLLVAFMMSQTGSELGAISIDPVTGDFEPVELDGLPENASFGEVNGSVATLYDFGEMQAGPMPGMEAFENRLTGEADGYRVELVAAFDSDGSSTGTYTVTDIATSEVVSTETIDNIETDFEYAEEVYDIGGNEEGFRMLDPVTGDVIVEIAFSDMTVEMIDAEGNVIDLDTDGDVPAIEEDADVEAMEVEPETWLLATDGSTWIIDELGGEQFGVASGAVQNGVLVVAFHDGSLLRYEFG